MPLAARLVYTTLILASCATPNVGAQATPPTEPIAADAAASGGQKLQSYVECGAVLQLLAIMQMLNERSAPPYAKDKYQKRYQFYLQGSVNIEDLARATDGYVKEKYSELVDAKANAERELLSDRYLPVFNSKAANCIGIAGLNRADLP